jgi:hypothetical protein
MLLILQLINDLSFMEIDKDNLHHAYLLIGAWDKEHIVPIILDELSIERENNPDFIVHEGPLGIDDARNITQRIQSKPFGDKRVLIIDAGEVTLQAQNALLKTLEEPGEGNHFFLVAPYEDVLLPTLRSRLHIIRSSSRDSRALPSPAGLRRDSNLANSRSLQLVPDTFLKLTPAKRLEFAKKFKESEKPLGPFLDSLLHTMKIEKMNAKDVEKIFTVRRFADDQSSDARLILEHISLMLE